MTIIGAFLDVRRMGGGRLRRRVWIPDAFLAVDAELAIYWHANENLDGLPWFPCTDDIVSADWEFALTPSAGTAGTGEGGEVRWHSKGPWTWDGDLSWPMVKDANGDDVCETIRKDGQVDADLRLIAAAPELFTLLAQLLVHVGTATPNVARREQLVREAEALLARIEAPSQGGTGRGT